MNRFSLAVLVTALALASCTGRGDRTVVASRSGITLDSDVYNGGGTDQTDAIQAILDKAEDWGRLHFIMDGAALVSRPLRVHSNTTIECPDRSCGFYLADSSNCSVITNAHQSLDNLLDRNITLIGGVYNNNFPAQVHDRATVDFFSSWVFGMEFYGVEHLTMKGVTIADQRTFALTMANWKFVDIEDLHVDRRRGKDNQNQDGLHFFGPGRFLTLKNIYGNSGDDFIAIAPDEVDHKSSISDVLIDGVMLDDADQGIRLLCCGEGRLDRVTVRNVTGTYKSFGFIITPWFASVPGGGHYGDIVFENINLSSLTPNYDYSGPFLFKIGGNVENLVLKNVHIGRCETPHRPFIIGGRYNSDNQDFEGHPTRIRNLVIDGLLLDGENYPYDVIDVRGADIELLKINDAVITAGGKSLVKVSDSTIGTLLLDDVWAPKLDRLTVAPPGAISRTLNR